MGKARLQRLIRRTAKPVAVQVVASSGGSSTGAIGITDVTGLSAALTAKADASHGHVAGDITDLDDVLNEYVTATELTAALSGLGGSGLTHPQVLARGLGA